MQNRTILIVSFILFQLNFGCKSKNPEYVYLGSQNTDKGENVLITPKEYLKGYTMCKCVEYAYKKKSINLNEGSATLFRELDDDVINQKADSVITGKVKTYIDRPQLSGSTPADGSEKYYIINDCFLFSETNKMKATIDSLLEK